MNAGETSRKRSAADAGHEADDAGRGDVQPDPDSMAGNSMPAGAYGLSAGVATDLRLGWDLGLRADQVKALEEVERREKPHLLILSPMCLAFSQSLALNTKPDE